MKRHALALLILALTAAPAAYADLEITVTAASNVLISTHPDGPLDGPMQWASVGPNQLAVDSGVKGTVFCTMLGTNVVTITGVSQGNTLTEKVRVIVVAPPATTLGVAAVAVPK